MSKPTDTRLKYKTRWYHRHPKYWFRKDRPRPAGHRETPEIVRLDPLPGFEPSSKPPVRIFLGTEPMQARAERVFIWSVARNRNPARTYEIHLMKDLKGFDRTDWTTGFTNYRYAIPALGGEKGRAIYNDVDQIYLGDPAEMFDLDMGDAAILGVNKGETSVSLIDCERMAPHWRISDARKPLKRKHFLEIIDRENLWGPLPQVWNVMDDVLEPGVSRCFHFTTLRTQPWRPFEDQLHYERHEYEDVWFGLERSADAARFNAFSREAPSSEFAAAIAAAETDAPPAPARLRELLSASAAKSLLVVSDRGGPVDAAGVETERASLGDALRAGANRQFDGVLCLGEITRLPEADVPWALDVLFDRVSRFLAVAVAIDPERTGRAGALPAAWWKLQMELAHKRAAPGKRWSLSTLSGRSRSSFQSAA